MDKTMKSKRTSCPSVCRAGIRPAGPAERGFAWLIFDAGGDLYRYQCDRMGSRCDDYMIERAGIATDTEAVGCAAARTTRARIRMPEHCTYRATSGPCPSGPAGTWRGEMGTSNPDRVPMLV
jgi:hypothetical protein